MISLTAAPGQSKQGSWIGIWSEWEDVMALPIIHMFRSCSATYGVRIFVWAVEMAEEFGNIRIIQKVCLEEETEGKFH